MIDLEPLYSTLEKHSELQAWSEQLPAQLEKRFDDYLHGKLSEWLNTIEQLPKLPADQLELNQGLLTVTSHATLTPEQQRDLKEQLLTLSPWRKGPYSLHGVHIETEWRSDWKWDRLTPHIAPLKGRKVLDIGCGSGYHCWRMIGAGAELVLGLDPSQLFLAQFLTVKHFFGQQWPVYFLPLGVEALPAELNAFDTVFSMGVLYHRRSPIDHLLELKSALRPGGELVLETLIIDGVEGHTLLPAGRYSKMRNVWFIPSPDTLVGWMERCGFQNVRVVDLNETTTDEQHRTEWMTYESLADYLDPDDPNKTVEGYPRPKRAIVIANRP